MKRFSGGHNCEVRTSKCETALLVAALLVALSAHVGSQATPAESTPVTPLSSSALQDSARARLSQIEGRIDVPGLDSVVEVRRDRWGVPHIYARTQHDLFFAQGYVAAQDRLWQMEMWRRAGEGRLAELVGAKAVERDKFARLVRYRGDMEAEWKSYAPDAKQIVRAFVQGVNAHINHVKDRPPIEFTLLGIAPEPWSDAVPLLRLAAFDVSGNADQEVLRARLVALAGRKKTEQLWPTDPYRALDPAPGLDLGGIDTTVAAGIFDAARPVGYERITGSNNWVVKGSRSATGKPLLANDPHRSIALPSLRYITHLVAPGWNVIGAGEPALPGVALGHNERIGFGFTVVGMDQQDIYVEQVRDCGARGEGVVRRCSLHRGVWKPTSVLLDTIRVRGEPPRVVSLEFTRHGPVVGEDSGRVFVLRSATSEPGAAAYLASLSLDRAHDWRSFLAAAARWKTPTENLVYADVDGNIGWVAAGLMPVRRWSGLLPVPGDGRYEWDGWVPFARLPKSYNPAAGFIVTANHNILPRGYTIPLNYEFAPPHRADRIREVLRDSTGWTVAAFERLQHDEYLDIARRLLPALLSAAKARGLSERDAVRVLARWNFEMSRDSMAPLLYQAWYNALSGRVYAALASAAASDAVPYRDAELVVRMATGSEWRAARRDSMALSALDEATADLTRRLGGNRSRWVWGALHRAYFRHPLAEAFDLPAMPRGGNGQTVNMTGGGGLLQTSGASFREILDPSDWDNSVATSTPGQSGQPGSAFYGDLLPLWGRGEYFPLAYSRAMVERETKHVLMLVPR
ncbi:MAG: penicillin acylase family protein [Gemmatimonadaceae bacterium]